jgi:hypothetical protein
MDLKPLILVLIIGFGVSLNIAIYMDRVVIQRTNQELSNLNIKLENTNKVLVELQLSQTQNYMETIDIIHRVINELYRSSYYDTEGINYQLRNVDNKLQQIADYFNISLTGLIPPE